MEYIRQYEPDIGTAEREELLAAFDSGWITEAQRTEAFEERFSEYVGSKYAIAVTSGTVAIAVALMALGIGQGDKVIVPNLTMAGTANAVLLANAVPVFADVQTQDGNIDPDEVTLRWDEHVKAVIAVHLNGRPANLAELRIRCDSLGLHLLEDAAQALGSRIGERNLGTLSEVGCFSLATTKVLTTGQGGMVVTDNPALYQRVKRLKDHGRLDRSRDIHEFIGFNFKFTDLQAAVGLGQFKGLRERVQRKKDIYSLYHSVLSEIEDVTFLQTDLDITSPWFVDVLVPEPQTLIKHLHAHGVGSRAIYPPLHNQLSYRKFSQDHTFPNTQQISNQGVWLPCSTFLTDEQVVRVAEVIRSLF